MPYPIIWIGITNKRNGKILGSPLLNEPRSDKIKSGNTYNKSTSNKRHSLCNVNKIETIENLEFKKKLVSLINVFGNKKISV